jgi:DNA-binding NtrC family response regulator
MPSHHVLVVASRADRRQSMEQMLRSTGQVVVPGEEPRTAAEAITTPGLDFVLLDLTVPQLDLPALQRAIRPSLAGPPDSLESAERRHIALTLEYTAGNRRDAARILGIARSTLLAKLRKYQLESVSKR